MNVDWTASQDEISVQISAWIADKEAELEAYRVKRVAEIEKQHQIYIKLNAMIQEVISITNKPWQMLIADIERSRK